MKSLLHLDIGIDGDLSTKLFRGHNAVMMINDHCSAIILNAAYPNLF